MSSRFPLFIECRVHKIDVLLVQFFPQQLHGFPKALEVYDLPLPEKFDHIIYIRVIGQPENVIISDPGFLFGTQVLGQISDGISLYLQECGSKWNAGCRLGINTHGMVNKIGRKGRILDLAVLQVPGKLMHNGTDHFKMAQLFCTGIRNVMTPRCIEF